jgi:hypothetical protein
LVVGPVFWRNLFPSFSGLSVLKMEASDSSKMLIPTVWHHFPEDCSLNICPCESLRCRMKKTPGELRYTVTFLCFYLRIFKRQLCMWCEGNNTTQTMIWHVIVYCVCVWEQPNKRFVSLTLWLADMCLVRVPFAYASYENHQTSILLSVLPFPCHSPYLNICIW